MYDVNSRDHSLKDPAEFVECVLCATTQRRDVLCRILPDVDGSLCNGRCCPAARIALDRHGDPQNQDVLSDIFIGGKIRGRREA